MASSATNDRNGQRSRRGVRRTVTVLAIVVGVFYALAFVQILLLR